MSDHKPMPMGRENKQDDFVVGYMDLTDFQYELGMASGGNKVFPSIEDCRANNGGCIEACGIVEVEVRARRIVQKPTDED